MPSRQMDDLVKSLQEPAYTAVGLGVLAFQRAQVYRRQAQRQASRASRAAAELGRQLSHDVEVATGPSRERAAEVADEALAHLPEPARDLVEAMGNLVAELPKEAQALAKEAWALGRFAVHAASAPASRFAARQGH